MFGKKGITLDKSLMERVKHAAAKAGYASVDEYVTHVIERSFDAQGAAVVQRHAALRHWPPRPGAAVPLAVEAGPVTEGEADAPLQIARARTRREPVAA